ncbi:serine protease 27-like [Colossoma macropomum]|uniref:serine protease 27-like n=1 Tax=Colossoma macropomum TaxID=42526 RepID=UPI001865181E|nr:serine protease 27-like [Colossoma macropomum]
MLVTKPPNVPTSVPTTATVTTSTAVVCGSAKLNSITGGGNSLASAGVWPWMASLQRNGIHVCGGTLVAEQFVLSSGDCFSSSTSASDWTVILGRLKQNGPNANEVSISVTKISISSDIVNNAAVLLLSRKPTLSDHIQPICVDLGDNSFTVNTQCWASGWGSGGGGTFQTLQQFNTTILDCGSASSSNRSICTGVMPLEQTNIGGPLMCKVGQSWVQPAVLTLVPKLSRASDVQVFIKISSVAEFLREMVGTFPPKANTTSTNTTTVKPVSSTLPANGFSENPLTVVLYARGCQWRQRLEPGSCQGASRARWSHGPSQTNPPLPVPSSLPPQTP